MVEKRHIQDFMRGFTIETTPGASRKITDYRAYLCPRTRVYITFLPGSDFADTIAVAKRLKDEGFTPVPHFAARSIPNQRFLEQSLERLQGEVDIDQALVIGGGIDKPAGDYDNSMQLLETGLFDAYGIRKIGVAGHPEGSLDMSDKAIRDALRWKNAFAERTGAELYVVTQFCFEAEPIIAWDKALRAEGNKLPITVGIPGLATLKALLGHAKVCGIGASMRVLTRQARNLSRLLSISAPDKLVMELAAYRASDPGCGIHGVHLYPLGGLKKSAAWSYGVVDGHFTVKRDGSGFEVDLELPQKAEAVTC